MMDHPDIEVFFEFNGVRKTPVHNGYRPAHLLAGSYLTSGTHHYYDSEWIPPSGVATGTITFITPEAHQFCLRIGEKISIQEGARIVGHATILRIFNPMLEG